MRCGRTLAALLGLLPAAVAVAGVAPGAALTPAVAVPAVAGHPGALRPADRAPRGAPAATPAAAAGARPVAAAAAELPATITLDSVTPAIPVAHGSLSLSGRIRNDSATAIPNPYVRLRISADPLDSRAQINDIVAGSDIREGQALQATRQNLGDALEPGSEEAFSITVPVDDLLLGDFGVYVLSVEGREPRFPSGPRIGITRTFLPWVPPKTTLVRTKLAWLWPLADSPHRDAAGAFFDDALAAALAPGGRLGALVATAASTPAVPVTWAVDPMLLDDAATMATGYQVRSGRGKVVAGESGGTAAAWLAGLTRALRPDRVAALPYAAPDVVAMTRRGVGADVAAAADYGRARAAEVLHLTPVTDLGLPPDGYADPAALATLAQAGDHAVVLAGSTLPPTADLTYTPTGRATTANGLEALLTDDRLVAVAASNPLTAEQTVSARQLFLAETAMITAEAPSGIDGQPRSILVALPLRWAPSRTWATELLRATAAAPWLAATDVAAIRALPVPTIDRGALTYPADARRREPAPALLNAIASARREIETFLSVLSKPDPAREGYERMVWRLESTTWRGAKGGGFRAAYLDLREAVVLQRNRVHVLPAAVTLAARSGRIPVTVANDLDQSVTVGLSVEPNNRRLEVGTIKRVVIGPSHKQQVLVPATALANGLVLLDVRIEAPDGSSYGDPVIVRVSVSQYGTVGTYITIAAAVVLFGTAAIRIFRRIRGARQRVTAEEPA